MYIDKLEDLKEAMEGLGEEKCEEAIQHLADSLENKELSVAN